MYNRDQNLVRFQVGPDGNHIKEPYRDRVETEGTFQFFPLKNRVKSC